MKILYITPAYYPNVKGGSEKSLRLLAEGIAKDKKFKVCVVSFDNEVEKESVESYNKVKVIRIKKINIKPNTLAQNISLLLNKKVIDQENPDIIHIYNTWHIPGGFFLKKKNRKIIATLNNYYPICALSYTKDNFIESKKATFVQLVKSIYATKEGNKVKKSLLAFLYATYSKIVQHFSKKIDGYISYTHTIKTIYAIQGFDSKKIKVVPSLHQTKSEKVRYKKREEKNLLYVGGILESKGVMELIEAMAYLNKDIKLTILGKGVLEEKAKSFVKKNSLNVEFRGRVSEREVQEYMKKATALVHPSKWPEPFSRVWLEATYHQIPIISANNPVAKEVLRNVTFYKRDDPKELAEKINKFFLEKKHRKPSLNIETEYHKNLNKVKRIYDSQKK